MNASRRQSVMISLKKSDEVVILHDQDLVHKVDFHLPRTHTLRDF